LFFDERRAAWKAGTDAGFSASKRLRLHRGAKPVYYYFETRTGEIAKLDAVQARYVFCKHYEKAVRDLDQFRYLRMLAATHGKKLLICGPHAFPSKPSSADIHRLYRDPETVFGWELSLYALLTCKDGNLPWDVYAEENKDVYHV